MSQRVRPASLAPVVALLLVVAGSAPVRGSRAAPREIPPVVIAVVESGGMNVLHTDFRLRAGERLALPAAMPPTVEVELPRSGSFEQRMRKLRSSPLGAMEAGTLYRIKGTRIIGVYTAADDRQDITEDRFHATGTTSAAVGSEHGTNPDALLVFVADSSRGAWEWLVNQKWIDIISTSYYSFSIGSDSSGTCTAGPAIRRIAEQGRLVFSAIGNGEQAGIFFTPSGWPDAYQVGAVDDDGRSFRPDAEGRLGPTRPYETGDRFVFPSADADSLSGSMEFGGTSGATPSTAGRAAELVTFARRLLHSRTAFEKGALARLGPGGTTPQRGPLADGKLTRDELIDVMHHAATPAEPPSPARYLLEGYGAFQENAVDLAKEILSGNTAEPERPDEDQMHEAVETARRSLFPDARC